MGFLVVVVVVVVEYQNCQLAFRHRGYLSEISATTTCLHEAFHSKSYHILFYGHHPGWCNCPVSSWPFATGGISVEISATTTCLHEAFPYLRWRYPWGVLTHITLFTGTTQDGATALLVVGAWPQGVSQWRYPYNYVASMRCFHILVWDISYNTIPGVYGYCCFWPYSVTGRGYSDLQERLHSAPQGGTDTEEKPQQWHNHPTGSWLS